MCCRIRVRPAPTRRPAPCSPLRWSRTAPSRARPACRAAAAAPARRRLVSPPQSLWNVPMCALLSMLQNHSIPLVCAIPWTHSLTEWFTTSWGGRPRHMVSGPHDRVFPGDRQPDSIRPRSLDPWPVGRAASIPKCRRTSYGSPRDLATRKPSLMNRNPTSYGSRSAER